MSKTPDRMTKIQRRQPQENRALRRYTPVISTLQFKSLVQVADPEFSLEIQFAGTTGLRRKEQFDLCWRDVDVERGIVILPSVCWSYGESPLSGMRAVPLNSEMTLKLAEWRVRSHFSGDDNLVFPNKAGNEKSADVIGSRFRKLCDRLKENTENSFPEGGVVWHCLRRFADMCWKDARMYHNQRCYYLGLVSVTTEEEWALGYWPQERDRRAMDLIQASINNDIFIHDAFDSARQDRELI